MSNEYLDSLNKLARKRQLALTKEQEKAIYRVYDKAASDYYEKFVTAELNCRNDMRHSRLVGCLLFSYV